MRLKCDESDEFWNFVRDYDIEKPFSEQSDIMLEAFPNSNTTHRVRSEGGMTRLEAEDEIDERNADPYSLPNLLDLMQYTGSPTVSPAPSNSTEDKYPMDTGAPSKKLDVGIAIGSSGIVFPSAVSKADTIRLRALDTEDPMLAELMNIVAQQDEEIVELKTVYWKIGQFKLAEHSNPIKKGPQSNGDVKGAVRLPKKSEPILVHDHEILPHPDYFDFPQAVRMRGGAAGWSVGPPAASTSADDGMAASGNPDDRNLDPSAALISREGDSMNRRKDKYHKESAAYTKDPNKEARYGGHGGAANHQQSQYGSTSTEIDNQQTPQAENGTEEHQYLNQDSNSSGHVDSQQGQDEYDLVQDDRYDRHHVNGPEEIAAVKEHLRSLSPKVPHTEMKEIKVPKAPLEEPRETTGLSSPSRSRRKLREMKTWSKTSGRKIVAALKCGGRTERANNPEDLPPVLVTPPLRLPDVVGHYGD